MRPDGTLAEILPDGIERPFPKILMRPMTDEEVATAAASDPNVRPMTEEEFRKAPRVPRTKTLRRALGLTQTEFATRFQIPLRTLRNLG